MPNQPRPGEHPRSVRVPDELWEAARQRATENGEDVSKVILRALVAYTRPRKH